MLTFSFRFISSPLLSLFLPLFSLLCWADFLGRRYMFFGLFFGRPWLNRAHSGIVSRIYSSCLDDAFAHKTYIDRTIIIWILRNNLFSRRELNKQAYSWFSHDVTKIQTKKLSLLLSFYFHVVLQHHKTLIQTNFRFKRVLRFAIQDAWISRLLRDAAFSWRPGKLLCGLKTLPIVGDFVI